MNRNWITIEKGFYQAVRSYLVTSDSTHGAALSNAAIEITTGSTGQKQLHGFGRLQNALMVELLEYTDEIDIIIDLGGVYKYRFKAPEISGGKLFTPHVEATIRFTPVAPWQQIEPTRFESDLKKITFLNKPTWTSTDTQGVRLHPITEPRPKRSTWSVWAAPVIR